MIDIVVDTAKLNRLKTKFDKYPPFAIKAGLGAVNSLFNDTNFKRSMYPPSQAGSPFAWSSDKQRRFVFANFDLPYSRTFGLADAGQFKVNETYYTIEYTNNAPGSKYVIHPSYQIIGHRLRGWEAINRFIVKNANKLPIIKDFKTAAVKAWDDMDAFIFGGGGGL